MSKRETVEYSKEVQERVIEECLETKNYGAVAKKHGIPVNTVYGWVRKARDKDKRENQKSLKSLEKELADARLENRILKELLKKSHQLWLKE